MKYRTGPGRACLQTRAQDKARPEVTVEGRATKGKIREHDNDKQRARQDKLESRMDDEIEGGEGTKKFITRWTD